MKSVRSLLMGPVLLGMMAASAMAEDTQVQSTQSSLANAPRSLTALTQNQPVSFSAVSRSQRPQTIADSRLEFTDSAVAQLDAHSEPSSTTLADQVTSVSQLSDVRPTDWAFQALQSLVERYGCIVGYPDRTYRGNQALTRYEFAAGLNACIDRVNELIAAGTADLVRKEDLDTVRRLQEEFAVELATLRGRVDALEARTATLEKQQFSTTTKLNGEVVVAVAGVAAGDRVNGNKVQKNTILGDRIRLNFDTSFSGRDLLRTRLQAGNVDLTNNAVFTTEGSLRLQADSGNAVGIDALLYQFPIGEKTTVTLEANAGAIDDFTDTINPFLDGDGGLGALSEFGTRNPIYYLLGGAGIGVRHQFNDQFEVSLGYLADNGTGSANIPAAKNGLFNGPQGAIAQVTFKPSEALRFGLTYIHAYRNDFTTASSGVGSNNANFAANVGAFDTNSFGAAASFQLNPSIVINGSVGYTRANDRVGSGKADIWNWMLGLAFPDLLTKGSVAGLIVGMEPKVTKASGAFDEDPDTSLHVEGFYQFQLNDNVSITPGLIWLTAPDHNNDNKDVVIGVIRTTFVF